MSSLSEEYRRKADELLSRATAEENLKRRSDLLDEAAHWHRKAVSAEGRSIPDDDETAD